MSDTRDRIIEELAVLLADNDQGLIDASTLRASFYKVLDYADELENEIEEIEHSGVVTTRKFTVYYNANGGDGYMDSQVVETTNNTVTIPVKGNLFYRKGYNFAGFKINNIGNTYSENGSIPGSLAYVTMTYPTTSVELYAQWEYIEEPTYTYTLNYNKNISSSTITDIPSSVTATSKATSYTFNISNNIPKDSSSVYEFKNWGEQQNGGNLYNPGDAITLYANSGSLTSSKTLYAQWEHVQTVTYTYGINYRVEVNGYTYEKTITTTSTSKTIQIPLLSPDSSTLFLNEEGYQDNMVGKYFDCWIDRKGRRYTVGSNISLDYTNPIVEVEGSVVDTKYDLLVTLSDDSVFRSISVYSAEDMETYDLNDTIIGGKTIVVEYELVEGITLTAADVSVNDGEGHNLTFKFEKGKITVDPVYSNIFIIISPVTFTISLTYPTITQSGGSTTPTVSSATHNGVAINLNVWSLDPITVNAGDTITINFDNVSEYDNFRYGGSNYITTTGNSLRRWNFVIGNPGTDLQITPTAYFYKTTTTDVYYTKSFTVSEMQSNNGQQFSTDYDSYFTQHTETEFTDMLYFCMYVILPNNKSISSCVFDNQFANDIASEFSKDNQSFTQSLRNKLANDNKTLWSYYMKVAKDSNTRLIFKIN